jgi:REP element-mobilizing transposase RayT
MKGFVYSQEAVYFVTICSHEHNHIFEEVSQIGENNVFIPSRIGELVEENYFRLPELFPEFHLIHFSLLPNHLHFLTMKKNTDRSNVKNLSDLVGAFKSLSDRAVRNEVSVIQIWQKSFHDHIIRDE